MSQPTPSPVPPHLPHVLVVLLVATATLAGCLDADGDGDGPGLTAQQARTLFEASGQTPPAPLPWHDAMVLVGIGAIETATTDVPASVDAPPFPFSADTLVGDGRAPEWFLNYADGASGDAVVVRVAGPADITFHENHDPDMVDEHAIAAWQVDSDEAIRVAKTDTDMARLLAEPDVAVSELLTAYTEDAAVWLVRAETPDGDTASVFVHATTGETMSFADLIKAANPQTGQTFTFTGALDADQSEATHGYQQQGQGYDVWANLTYSGGWADTTHLDLALRHDDHPFEITEETRSHETGDTRYHWLDVGAGGYTVTVRAQDGGVPSDGTVRYELSIEIVPRG